MSYLYSKLPETGVSPHIGTGGFDPDNPVQGTAVGLKLRGDAWLNPTPQTLAAFEAEYATGFQTHYAKGKLGYDLSSGREIFFGPEATFLGRADWA